MRKILLVAGASLALPFAAAHAQSPATTTAPDAGSAAAPAAVAPTAEAPAGAPAQASAATAAATAADFKAGVAVLDQTGARVGTMKSVSGNAAVVSTGKVKAQIPFASFAKSDKGLVIAMSKSQLEAAASKGKAAS